MPITVHTCSKCGCQLYQESDAWVDFSEGDTCPEDNGPHVPWFEVGRLSTFDGIAQEQGWDDANVILVLRTFIREKGLESDLVEMARDVAAIENGGEVVDG